MVMMDLCNDFHHTESLRGHVEGGIHNDSQVHYIFFIAKMFLDVKDTNRYLKSH